MEEEEEDEDLRDLFDWIDLQPWTEEDYERMREMREKGGLTKEEREWCRRCCS